MSKERILVKEGIKGVANAIVKASGNSEENSEDRFSNFPRQLGNFFKIVSELDCGETLDLRNVRQKTYDKIVNQMREFTINYNITNIIEWCNIKSAYQLYNINSENKIEQILFYQEFRMFLLNVYQTEEYIPTSRNIINKKKRIANIYSELIMEFQVTSNTGTESKNKRNIQKMSTTDLKKELEEIKEEIKCPSSEEESATKRHYERKIINLYHELLYRDLSKDEKRMYEKELEKYKKEHLRQLMKNLMFNDTHEYLILSICEKMPLFPFSLEEPESENLKNIYTRCLERYNSREVIENIISEVESEIDKELTQREEEYI